MSALQLVRLQAGDLDPIDLRVSPGECLALWGPSGSGKTRLMRAIADLDPNRGEALCGDTPRSALPASEWRRRVGYLPAESHWWGDRIGDHFPLGVDAGLARLGLTDDALGWRVERISSGERQRLALLRMLALGPEVLLLDEATANLDRDNIALAEGLIESYCRERAAAVLWVSHDPDQRRRIARRGLRIVGRALEAEGWS